MGDKSIDAYPVMGYHGEMTLAQYLRDNKLTDGTFAARIGCSAGAVRKWKYGERMPRPEQIKRIADATAGAVSAIDLLPVAPVRNEGEAA